MAGICGWVSGRGGGADQMDPMLAAMADYGAESTAWSGAGWSLGLRHGAAAQLPPKQASWRTGGLAVVAAARLDNRDELGDALGLPLAAGSALADQDLILAAYRRWGRECPDRLLGDYAFAIWDSGRGLLFCARDHIGVQPFYYAETSRGFAFASAVEGVLAAPGVPDELDETIVSTFLRGNVHTTTRTFFRAVRKLPPGHSMVVKGGVVRLRRWWRPEELPRLPPASDDDYAAQFLRLYHQAVQDCLHGPDPVGIHLSGGLDSSSISVLAARELRRQGRPPPLAFTWLPPLGEAPLDRRPGDEYAALAAVAAQEDLQVFYESPNAADVVADLGMDAAFPRAFEAGGPEGMVLRQAAAQGVKVLLSGWGGDDGMSYFGQGHYAALLLRGCWLRFFAETRAVGESPLREATKALWRVFPYGFNLSLATRRLGKRLRGKPIMPQRVVLHPEFARRVRPLPRRSWFRVGVRRSQLTRWRMGLLLMRLEGWAARGAHYGLEYRYPLLDRRLLEFALGLPPEQFKRPAATRWLMRHALSAGVQAPSVLPPQVCWHRSKAEPTLFEALNRSFTEALLSIRQEIAASPPPSRARYIDVQRLLECLDLSRFEGGRIPFLEISNAISFLDFQQRGR